MQNKTKHIVIGSVALVMIVAISYFAINVGYSNGEIRQRNLTLAQKAVSCFAV